MERAMGFTLDSTVMETLIRFSHPVKEEYQKVSLRIDDCLKKW
jgi:hypothetical protein